MEDELPQPSTADADADAAYPGFPDPGEWLALDVDMSAWDAAAAAVAELRASDPDLADDLRERAFREAGLDTGAIEGLYTTDRGFTMSVADAANAEEAARLVKMHKGPDVEALYRAQVEGYEMALDLVAQERPLTESWIRQLHEVITGPQDTYEVATPIGPQVHDLPKGEYKRNPNHVIQADGTLFPYAPVAETPHEMARFVELANSDALGAAHPVVAAAWLHYALVRIHPFADGNGRVTRAVASIPLLRVASVPLTIPPDERDAYIAGLEAADASRLGRFVRVVRDESMALMRLLARMAQSSTSDGPPASDLLRRAVLEGNVDDPMLDEAALEMFQVVEETLRDRLEARDLPGVEADLGEVFGPLPPGERSRPPDGWRRPHEREQITRSLVLRVRHPVYVAVAKELMVLIDRQPQSDQLLIHTPGWPSGDEQFTLSELRPRLTTVLRRRLEVWADHVLDRLGAEIAPLVREKRSEEGL